MDTSVADLGPLLPYNEQAAAVDEAVRKALDLVQQFSEYDPNDHQGPWMNPDNIYQQLDQARTEISQAWKELDAVVKNDHEAENATTATTDKDKIRVAYMDMITDSFSEVLENLRLNAAPGDPLDVEVLVDCLQSGLDLLNMNGSIQLSEADFLWNEDDEDTTNEMNDDEDTLTPHERRRRQLGFHLEESTA
jgi:hypothetical protein